MQFTQVAKKYLRERQTPVVFYLHITVILLIISQLIFSNFIKISEAGQISKDVVNFYGTWAHIVTGIFLTFITLIFITFVLKANSFKHFFPYLFGNFSQILSDINQLISRKLPDANPGGLATAVQGLGIGALLLVVSSGIAWFIFWSTGGQSASAFREIHGELTVFVIAYLIGHGGMGVIHIMKTSKHKI